MILYFSETEHTAGAAQRIQEILGEETLQLQANPPYSAADLNWRIDNCRANQEQREELPFPSLQAAINLEAVKRIYLGFPIWWGAPPKIIDVFLRSHILRNPDSLENISIMPFCTSGSSPIAEAEEYLYRNYPEIKWLPGIRYRRHLTAQEIRTWAVYT